MIRFKYPSEKHWCPYCRKRREILPFYPTGRAMEWLCQVCRTPTWEPGERPADHVTFVQQIAQMLRCRKPIMVLSKPLSQWNLSHCIDVEVFGVLIAAGRYKDYRMYREAIRKMDQGFCESILSATEKHNRKEIMQGQYQERLLLAAKYVEIR